MKNLLRPSKLDAVLARNLPQSTRRELAVNPDGGFFDARDLAKALRRAAHGDIIFLPAGEYPAFDLQKNVELRSMQDGPVVIKGTVKVQAEYCLFIGLELRSEAGRPALQLEKGTLVLDDCTINGGINAGAPGSKVQLFLKNCLAGNAIEGVVLTHQASTEISASRIANCRVGLALSEGSSAAVYNSRVESCVSTDESDPGIGIFAEESSVYCEGATLTGNGVGVYLKNSVEARLLGSLFKASETSALIAVDGAAASPLYLHSCVIDHQDSARCAQLVFNGGTANIAHTVIKPGSTPALTAEQTRLELLDSRFSAIGEPAIEARSCHLAGSGISCESVDATSFSATTCQGALRDSTFVGKPPVALNDSAQLLLDSCELRDKPAESPLPASAAITTIEGVINRIKKFVGQESVRNDLERILRLAHAGQQRKLQGLPVPEQSFHSIFMGPPGTGKLTAAHMLAEGLHAFGVVASPKVTEIPFDAESGAPARENPPERQGSGVVFLRAREATNSASGLEAAQKLLEDLVAGSRDVVVLEGERDELRRLLRSNPILDRAFRKTLHFTSFGPVELATHFVRLCEFDRIPVSDETTRAILLAVHLYCERKDKRFANTKGMDMLYEASRRRYLERCSLANRVDLKLEARDLDVPADKALRNAIERCPAFITFCPACSKENPWLAGLDKQCVCLHCDSVYTASWGIWKDSTTYRRTKESLTRPVETGAVTLRANLPAR